MLNLNFLKCIRQSDYFLLDLKLNRQLLWIPICDEYIAYIKIPIDNTLNGISYTEKKFEIKMPIPPKVETKAKPIEEQLAHVLATSPKDVPENKDLLNLNFEFLKIYIFILSTIPNKAEVILVKIKLK